MIFPIKFLVLLLTLALTGCVTSKVTYETPTTGQTAKFRLVNPDGKTYFATFLEAKQCTNRKKIFENQTGTSEYVSIRAEDDFAFILLPQPNWRRTCAFAGILKPDEGAMYNFKVSFTKSHCILDLVNESKDGETAVYYKPMQFVTPWTEKGSWCKEPEEPLSNKAKLYNPML